MKKLGKKIIIRKETIESYSCGCSCSTCYCGCACGVESGTVTAGVYATNSLYTSNNQSSDTYEYNHMFGI